MKSNKDGLEKYIVILHSKEIMRCDRSAHVCDSLVFIQSKVLT